MARGRQPQFSADDLINVLGSLMGSPMRPTTDPMKATAQSAARGTAKAAQGIVDKTVDWTSPLTVEEIRRMQQSGPDRGHLASLALFGAFVKSPEIFKGIRTALRSASSISKDKGVQPPKPARKQAANVAGTANDPMAIYALLSALENRR